MLNLEDLTILNRTDDLIQLWVSLEDFLLSWIASEHLEGFEVLSGPLSLLEQFYRIKDTTEMIMVAVGDKNAIEHHLTVLRQVIIKVLQELLILLG